MDPNASRIVADIAARVAARDGVAWLCGALSVAGIVADIGARSGSSSGELH